MDEPSPIYDDLLRAGQSTARHRLDPNHPDYDPRSGRPQERSRVTTTATPPPYIRYPRAAVAGYRARDVAAAYGAPVGTCDGSGATVGVISLGGTLNPADLDKAGIARKSGQLTVVPVDGAKPVSDPQGADGENALDVQTILSVAPGASVRMYCAPNTDRGFLDAIRLAVTECDAVSISWGSAETQWSRRTIQSFAAAFADARSKGKPVFAAAGDAGSRDGTQRDVTDYPASDPNVIGCGGTRLVLDGSGKRASEITWNNDPSRSATGGGVSSVFQGRGVPDVAGNADPETGYLVTVNGQTGVIGGTSAVAPLYAAMWALDRQASHGKPYDLLNAILTNPAVCYDVTVGDNGGWKAGPGRDNVSGYGVVDHAKLLAILTSGTQIPLPGGGAGTTSGGTQGMIPAPPGDLMGFLRWLRDLLNQLLGKTDATPHRTVSDGYEARGRPR